MWMARANIAPAVLMMALGLTAPDRFADRSPAGPFDVAADLLDRLLWSG